MNDLKEVAKIGKSILIQLVGVQPNFKQLTYTTEIDENICESSCCEIYKMKQGLMNSGLWNSDDLISQLQETHCNHCEKAKVTEKVVEYYNEKNKYKIPDIIDRLSKLQVKQFVLYHFLFVDKRGIVRNISTKEIASILGCTTKTVQVNNKRLTELNYIWVSNIDNDRFNLLLKGYNTYHLTAKEGGSGYLYMSKEMLSELLAISNVNTLRLEIRKLIKFDDNNIGATEPKPVTFTYKDISRFLPGYVNYRGIVEDILSQQSNAFTNIIRDDAIEFTIKEEYNSDVLIQVKGYEYFDKFGMLVEAESLTEVFSNEDIGDLVQMSFEYNFEIVFDAVKVVIENYIKQDKEVGSIGALVRQIVRNMLKDFFKVTA